MKLAVIREAGYPVGQTAPCWLNCPCGNRVPAYEGEQECECGVRYNASGWVIS